MSKYYSLISLTWRQRNGGNINGNSLLNVTPWRKTSFPKQVFPCHWAGSNGRAGRVADIPLGQERVSGVRGHPNRHTNRSTESCGTSLNSESPVGMEMGRSCSPASDRCLHGAGVPRNREERAFVCLDERPLGVRKCALGERFISLVRPSELQTEWSLTPCR